jgi:hypothetical protein
MRQGRSIGLSEHKQEQMGSASAVGTLAAGAAAKALGGINVTKFLRAHGISNTAAHAIQAAGNGAVWGGGTAAGDEAGKKIALGDKYKVDKGEIAQNAATGALFGLFNYVAHVAVTSSRNKAFLQQSGNALKSQYDQMKSALGTMTPEETARQANGIWTRAYDVEKSLDDMDIVGADKEVSAIKDFLGAVRGEMEQYSNYDAARLGGSANPDVPSTAPMLPSAPADSSVPAVREGVSAETPVSAPAFAQTQAPIVPKTAAVPPSAAEAAPVMEIPVQEVPDVPANIISEVPEMQPVNPAGNVPETVPQMQSAAPAAAEIPPAAPSVRPEADAAAPKMSNALSGVARTLGENGQKAMVKLFDGRDAGRYAQEFVQVYNDGKNGNPLGTTTSAPSLTSAQIMGAYYAGQNDSSASTDVPDTGLNSHVKSDMIDSESHPKKFIRAKKSDWSSTDSEWYVPGHKQPIAYSTISTRDSIGAMADDHPDASISELRDLFVYDEESKRVMSAYIDNGYGNQNANEWFSYSENHGLSKNGETTDVGTDKDGRPYIKMTEVGENGELRETQGGVRLHSEERGDVLQPMRPAEEVHGAVSEVPERDSGRRAGTEEPLHGVSKEVTPAEVLSDKISGMLSRGQEFNSAWLFEQADKAFGGTMADGTYTPKDAYDAMELAVNRTLMNSPKVKAANGDVKSAQKMLSSLVNMLKLLPTQTKRTPEMEQFQQFSTPPNIAYLAAWSAAIKPSDVVLEPSAGIGGLALWPKAWGATVYANELSERRLSLLNRLGLDKTFNENAEQIDNVLPDSVKPTAVIMNPPFSSTAGRTATNKTSNAGRHIEQALERLEPGGRLVAILGRGMADDSPAFRKWWETIKKEYNVRANIRIDGSNYHKYGTDFDIQLVVIDKKGPTKNTLTGEYKDLTEIPKVMEGIRNDRGAVQESAFGRSGDSDNQLNDQSGRGDAGNVGRSSGSIAGNGRKGSLQGDHAEGGSVAQPGGNRSETARDGIGGDRRPVRGNQSGLSGNVRGESGRREPSDRPEPKSARSGEVEETTAQLDTAVQEEHAAEAEEHPDSVYAPYSPRKVHIKGAKQHPAKLVESAAMSAVDPPDVTYTPNLPQKLISSGALSDAQLENIVYAGQAHAQMLPDGKRKGYFIGDGTGVGKGRQISGIIMDNFRQGRKKAVWISRSSNLYQDAIRDWTDLGGSKGDVLSFNKFKLGQDIPAESGILFSSYDTIKQEKGSLSRLGMIEKWLGKDFDGAIIFDEAHTMNKAVSQKGTRGKTKPAGRALAGIKLQQMFPNARIVYASATGATDVSGYAYLERLGLWGKGTAFNDVNDFIAKISDGGLAAMELVARDMKAMGVYMARSISYDDVKYDTLQHDLSPMQIEIYNTLSLAWQKVFQNINSALSSTNAEKNGQARSAAWSAFYGTQQRFYNQVLTSMSMPSVIEDMKKELDSGHSCVLQLVNTNQAAADRAIAKSEDEGTSLEDMDLTPSDALVQFLEKSFPVQAFEEYTDEKGNTQSRPVMDNKGNPVLDRKAVRQRDALIAEVKQMKVPDGPLEMLFDSFGTDGVAEVTGRTRRVVEKPDENGQLRRVVESRSQASGLADAQMFQDGKKRILVFSDAGGTGKSYHADLRAKNQQQRIHYLLQPGWNASNATQGFGRTHRSNEANAPVFRLVTTNIMGQKRFTSTIARRLDQLGALTKGQRQTGSGMFGEKDNLECPIAQDALERYYKVMPEDVARKLGIYDKLYDQFGMYKPDQNTARNIGMFLNRILSLEVDEQNRVFNGFYDTFDRMMDAAIASGSVDMGLENYVADKIEVQDEKVIRTDDSGADTKYVQLTAYKKPDLLTLNQVKDFRGGFQGLVRMEDDSVRAVYEISSKTNAKGEIERRFRLQSPEVGKSSVYVQSTMDEKTSPIDKKDWTQAWKEETAKAPEYNETKLHLLTGALLPIWNRLPASNTRVMRIVAGGKQYLGRLIRATDIDSVLRGLGSYRTMDAYTPEQISEKIMSGKTAVLRDDKVRIIRRRVSGQNRMEITGNNVWYLARNYPGIISERINYEYRYFIPTGDRGIQILKDLTSSNPVVDFRDSADDTSDQLIVINRNSQSVGSGDTSINSEKLPAIFSKVNWVPGTVNLDYGGGKFDNATEFLRTRGVTSYVLDKFNRSPEHNAAVAEKTQEGQSDTVTISNVLNVIKERSGRDEVLRNAADAVKPDGTVYITVYEGNGKGVGKYSQFDRVSDPDGKVSKVPKSWQENRLTSDYIPEVRKYFKDVTIKNKVIYARGPKKDSISGGSVDRMVAVSYPERWSAARSGEEKKPMPLSDIIGKIRYDFGINITTGHIRGSGTLGQYNRKDNGIRTKIANDLPSVSHELGHFLDTQYGLTDGLSSELSSELTGNLSNEMKSAYKESKWKREGLAEFMRAYLQNRETASIDYPSFTEYFKNSISAKDSALVDELADEVNAYYSLDAGTAESSVKFSEENGRDFRTYQEKIREKGDDFYQAWVDSNHGIKRFDRAAGTTSYKAAVNSAYADSVAAAILTGDLTDKDGQYVSRGLTAALNGINLKDKKEYRAFGEYLIVKHGPERLEEGMRIFADDRKNSTQWMEIRQEELEDEYPAFKEASERLYQFQRDFLNVWGVSTGLVSAQSATEWGKRWAYYVPFNRKIDRVGSGIRKGYANQTSTIHKAHGSGLDLIHPVDNIINNVVKMVNAGIRNGVMTDITKAAQKSGGMAEFLEKVPAPVQVKRFNSSDLKKSLTGAIDDSVEAGRMTGDNASAAYDIVENIDDILVQYGRGKAFGDVVTVLKNGKPEFWKINDPMLLSSITNLDAPKVPAFLEAYGAVSRFMVSNITGNNVLWSIFSNAPRDLMTFWTFSQDKNLIHLLGGIGSAYANKIKGMKSDPLYKEYLAMGGGSESVYSADRNLAKSVRAKITGDKVRWMNPVEVLGYVSDMIESGPRYSYYKLCREKYGMTPQEAIYEAHDITVNFRRGGVQARQLNRVIPFSNAGIQGIDKFARWATAAEVPYNLGSASRNKAIRGRMVAFMAASAALAALFYGLNSKSQKDKDNYAQLSNYTKNSYWCIPLGDGKYFTIPKPREIAVPSSFMEAAMEYFAGGNKHAFDEFYQYASDTVLPNVTSNFAQGDWQGAIGSLGIIGLGAYMMSNRDFLGKPIVSSGLQSLEPKDQYTARTSKMAVAIGRAFDVSPQMVDYFFGNTLGGWWKAQKALFPVGSENRDLTLGIQNSYVKDNQYSTDLVNRLFDAADTSGKKSKSNPSDMKAAVIGKMDSNMISFYSYYSKVSKGNSGTEARATRQTVLNMIAEYMKFRESGVSTEAERQIEKICVSTGSTEFLPSVMQNSVKDSSGKMHTLSDSQYVEYQTDYLKRYWEYVEGGMKPSDDESTKESIAKNAKDRAKTDATARVLKRVGASAKEDRFSSSKSKVSGSDVVRFKAGLSKASEDGHLTQDEVVSVIRQMQGLTPDQRSILFNSRYEPSMPAARPPPSKGAGRMEWTVVTVIVALVGLVSVFAKAAWSMSKSSQRLSDSVDRLESSIDDLKTDNKEFRDKLANHETRICLLEHTDENT